MKDNAGKIILSALVGATAGIAAGLLLAPETGEETRSNLKKSATKLGDDVNKILQKSQEGLTQAKTSATDLVGQGRAAANDALASLSTEAKDLAGKVTDQAKGLANQAKDLAGKVTDQVQGAADTAATAGTDTDDVDAGALVREDKSTNNRATKEAINLVEAEKHSFDNSAGPQPTPKVDPIEAKARHNAGEDVA